VIVDTSVLLDAFIETPFTASARALFLSGRDLFAPDHLYLEALGALTRMVRRGDITPAVAGRIQARLPTFMPNLESSDVVADRSFALSLELSHPLYDCVFLALAERRDCALVTLDRKFVRKLTGTPFARHVVHLADWQP
jgi:predicted nucleic acid-binding protein